VLGQLLNPEINMNEHEISHLVKQLAAALLGKGWRLATAESCTGGWVAKCCTDLAGSSAWFERGFITYSDAAKMNMLNVQKTALQQHGAVSEAVVRQMAQGARRAAVLEAALAVTGIAGPDGGSAEKPVGTVWFAWDIEGQDTSSECMHFKGEREFVRRQSVMHALRGLLLRLPG
jgi:nicotinamide-nucleotide amidase